MKAKDRWFTWLQRCLRRVDTKWTRYRQTSCMSHCKQMGLFNHRGSFKHLSKMCRSRTKKQEEMSDTDCWESQKNKSKLLTAQHYFSWLLCLWRSETHCFMLHFPILIGWMIKLLDSILSFFSAFIWVG